VTSRRLAWALWAVTVIGLIAAVAMPSAETEEDVWSMVASFVFALSFATVGALVASRQSKNPLGWIMCGAGLAYAVGGVSVTYVESTLAGGEDDLLETLADWVSSWVWMLAIGPAATFLLLLFPTGSLPSERWRPVAWLAGGALALMVGGIAAGVDAIAGLGSFLLLVAAFASVASLVFRFRRARSRERRQLKWLTYAAAVAGVVLLGVIVAESTSGVSDELSNTLVSVSIAALPVSMGIAILRHGLFDIDVVINRTLVYGALTATLVGAYVGAVLLLQLALSPLTEESDLAIAGSTLAVAALVRPLRRHIQAIVDLRFFRRRYDAQRTLEAFGVRLRDHVELDSLSSELRSVVAETMQPAHVSLWVRP
jgi:cytochrome bd-type quinol oxidase subunit 2